MRAKALENDFENMDGRSGLECAGSAGSARRVASVLAESRGRSWRIVAGARDTLI
jgi:hypothetical protein